MVYTTCTFKICVSLLSSIYLCYRHDCTTGLVRVRQYKYESVPTCKYEKKLMTAFVFISCNTFSISYLYRRHSGKGHWVSVSASYPLLLFCWTTSSTFLFDHGFKHTGFREIKKSMIGQLLRDGVSSRIRM